MSETAPLPSEEKVGQDPSSEAASGPIPAGSKKGRTEWHPKSWFSVHALAWYLLVVLVIAIFAPVRSVLHGDRGKSGSWGKLQGQTPEVIDWEVLGELDLFDHSMTTRLAALDGQMVVLPGYLIPLDDDFERAMEFLMVPYFGACTHVPPPPENQMVHVRLKEKIALDAYGWDPIWVAGRLQIRGSDMSFGSAAFQLEGLGARPYSLADSREN